VALALTLKPHWCWRYALQYNIMMHTCQDTASVQQLLQQMDAAQVAYDTSTFMTCYKVFERAREYDKAIKVLEAARDENLIAKAKVHTTTLNTLRRILKTQGPRAASKWVDCLRAHGAFSDAHAKLLQIPGGADRQRRHPGTASRHK
jgi:hypothetical protein